MQGLLLQIRSLWEILIKSKTILEELDWDAQSRLTGLRWTTLVWERVKWRGVSGMRCVTKRV
jgi:hypothetical protein